MQRASVAGLGITLILLASACRDAPMTTAPAPAETSTPGLQPPARPAALNLGAPIEESAPKVALADLAQDPGAWSGKPFATEGTVTAVCQHMGCWMELRGDGDGDGSAQAHVKMSGHHFFVPRTAAGHKARVLATLESGDPRGAGSCSDEGSPGSCQAEAETQLGHPRPLLELVADGVELM